MDFWSIQPTLSLQSAHLLVYRTRIYHHLPSCNQMFALSLALNFATCYSFLFVSSFLANTGKSLALYVLIFCDNHNFRLYKIYLSKTNRERERAKDFPLPVLIHPLFLFFASSKTFTFFAFFDKQKLASNSNYSPFSFFSAHLLSHLLAFGSTRSSYVSLPLVFVLTSIFHFHSFLFLFKLA